MMSLLRSLRAGWRRLTRTDVFERDLDDEVQHFVDLAAREHMRAGLSNADALRAARLEVGGVQSVKETARDGGWEVRADTVLRDVRYGLRSLRRHAAFTVAAVATLAVGIGGNTTVFSLINAVVLRPPPHVRAPQELVWIYTSDFSGPAYGASSYPDYEALTQATGLFSGVMLYTVASVGVGDGENLTREGLELVSANYFATLGVQPAAGRFFLPDEGRAGLPVPVAVVGYDLWQRTFGGRPDLVGSTVRLNGSAFTVVGIAPRGFGGSLRPLTVDVWVPITASRLLGAATGIDLTQRGNRNALIVARLLPGVSVAQAQASLTTVARDLAAEYPELWRDVSGKGRRLTLTSEAGSRVLPVARTQILGFMALLMGTVALVLLVCCANVASLTLARAARRTREMGVRLSLGASRGRVLRQLLTESAMVAAAGGVAGVALAWGATRAMMLFQPPLPVKVAINLGLDGRVLSFALLATLGTGLLFGIVPALRASRTSVTGMLTGGAASTVVGGRRVTLQHVLVVGQVAVSVLLLACALLFVRSLRAAAQIDTGFATDHLLLFDFAPRPDVRDSTEPGAVIGRLRDQLTGLPGVVGVSWGSHVPFGLDAARRGLAVDGYRPAEGEDMEYHFSKVGPGYFEVLRLPLVQGRGFTPLDRGGAPRVAVVSEAFARRFWKGAAPLGQRVSVNGTDGPWAEVVGVARDARQLSVAEAPGPFLYTPGLQDPGPLTVFLRTAVPPATLTDAVRRVVAATVPQWQATNVRSMDAQVGVSLLPQRVAGVLLSLFGATALLLAAVGLYGVVAFAVAARTREFGVRSALGARGADLVRLVLRQGAVLAGVGLVLGLPAAWAVSRLLSAFLIGNDAANAVPFVLAAALLASVALLASWIPARRASRVPPMTALRTD